MAGITVYGGDGSTVVRTWRLRDRSAVASVELSNLDKLDTAISFSADGLTLAACADSRLCLIDPYTGKITQELDLAGGKTIAFSPARSDVLVIQPATHTLRALHWPSGTTLWETAELPSRPTQFVFTPDGGSIVCIVSRDIHILDAGMGDLLHELRGHRAEVWCVDVSADGRTIATADGDGTLKLWHAATGQFLCEVPWEAPAADYFSAGYPHAFCAFSLDGRWLAVSAWGENMVQLLPLRQ